MSLELRALGEPGRDNLLRVTVNSGSRQTRLQFDCGDRCLHALPRAELRATSALFLSHLHMDHIAGFDELFRATFDRDDPPVHAYGPPGTADILHHRFRGYWWNIAGDLPGAWVVHDVHDAEVRSWRFRTADGYGAREPLGTRPHAGRIVEHEDYTVDAIGLSHHGTSLGWRVDEAARVSVVPDALAAFGRAPGPWLGALKARVVAGADGRTVARPDAPADAELERALARGLFEAAPREACAWLTDYLLDASTAARLAPWLAGVTTLVSEAQYARGDEDLAARHHHVVADDVAALARAAGVDELVLCHVSERYDGAARAAMLEGARSAFGATRFPEHWPEDDPVAVRSG